MALTPVLAALWFSQEASRGEGWRGFFLGWVFGWVFFAGTLAWLATVTIAGWLILAAYLALFPGGWAWFVVRVAKPRGKEGDDRPPWAHTSANLASSLLAASAWVTTEWLRGWLFTGFGWNGLAVAVVDNLPIIQIADIAGAPGIAFLVAFVNAVAVLTAARLRWEIAAGRMRPHYEFGLAVLAVAAAFAYGARKILAPPPPSLEVRFAAVQADIPIVERRDPARDREILEIHRELSESAVAMQPDLLVWPEAATPHPLFSDRLSWEVVSGLAEQLTGDFLLGTVHYAEEGDFNSAVLLTRQGRAAQLYHKMHLVPFGEYVPLRRAFPLFAWVVGGLVPDDFDAGKEAIVLEMASKPVRLGALICFEDTLAYISRQFAREGAQLFVTLTNNAWFLKSSAAEQHRANAVLRTIETRRPLVRAANTGVTCAIDTVGRETHRLRHPDGSIFFRGVLFGKVDAPLDPPTTLYARFGDWFVLVSALGMIAGAGWRLRK